MISFNSIPKNLKTYFEFSINDDDSFLLTIEKRNKKLFEYDWIVKVPQDNFKTRGTIEKITEDIFNWYNELTNIEGCIIKNQKQLINFLKG